ncbi:hypothetical protein [Niallia sp. MER TA 168]|uniref:hypothetical protein n=1 Tax=Niallia sp. MER TA 168 TaxID=2939568 RepID=UPI00203FFB44|nr:hypothetical protein [Niallia sp. MER TA 168]MCM3360940.1 hypothetical protein [Niallia sp. MER TA 168]
MNIPIAKINQLTYLEVIDKIIELNKHARDFWSDALGWAPIEASNLLSKSRLDWQVSLSYSMKKWNECSCPEAESGDLILAWANLGTLVEGTIKLFLSVYSNDYLDDSTNYKDRKGDILQPDEISFDKLRQYFRNKIWKNSVSASEFDDWVLLMQQRRNAIHAFKSREIDTFDDFKSHTKKYLAFLMYHLDRLPYPDDQYGPDLYL